MCGEARAGRGLGWVVLSGALSVPYSRESTDCHIASHTTHAFSSAVCVRSTHSPTPRSLLFPFSECGETELRVNQYPSRCPSLPAAAGQSESALPWTLSVFLYARGERGWRCGGAVVRDIDCPPRNLCGESGALPDSRCCMARCYVPRFQH